MNALTQKVRAKRRDTWSQRERAQLRGPKGKHDQRCTPNGAHGQARTQSSKKPASMSLWPMTAERTIVPRAAT